MATIENDASYLQGVSLQRYDIDIVKALITRASLHEKVGTAIHFLLEAERQIPPQPQPTEAEQVSLPVLSGIREDLDELHADIIKYAQCRGADLKLFYPTRNEILPLAQSYCAACSVQLECLFYGTYSTYNPDRTASIYGGTVDEVRASIRQAPNPPTTVEELGKYVATYLPDLLTMEFAEWELVHASRILDNTANGATHEVIGSAERIARLALDHFRGQPVDVGTIAALVYSRLEYRIQGRRFLITPKLLMQNLAPGSIEYTDDGQYVFSENGGYKTDKGY